MKKNKLEVADFLGHIDLFICSSGFEERSVSLGTTLNPGNIGNAIAFNMNENYAISLENIKRIGQCIKNINIVEYPKNNSIETFDIFYQTLLAYSKEKENYLFKIVIDITTFTREALLILVKVLSLEEFATIFSVKLVYTPAESYTRDWLTKGIREIRSIFGYSGMNYPSKKLLLIILNGFETERTEEIIDSFEANNIILGKPSVTDSINSSLSLISQDKFQLIKNKYEAILLEDFEFSCIDIIETKNILNNIINKYYKEYNIVISPLNNKISTLGAAIVGIKNDSIQICYASANQYNINAYSKGCDYFFIYNLEDLLR
jgi:hypothetical protein